MRLVTVKAPVGQGKSIAAVAFAAGIAHVSARQELQLSNGQADAQIEVIDIQTSTPKAKKFVEQLLSASFYDPATFALSVRHPESLFATEPPEKETHPIVRPSTDVYQELWQFTRITHSLVARVFLSGILLSYGMVRNMLPLIIAGLLFLPFHNHLLGIGLGGVLKEWRLLKEGILAVLTTTTLILLGGVCVALATEPPVGFQQFGSPLSDLVLSAVIGVAAGIAALDDGGRRELIGLAASAHVSVYPAWLGLELVFGTAEKHTMLEHSLTFGMNVFILTATAALTFALMGMEGSGIRKFLKAKPWGK